MSEEPSIPLVSDAEKAVMGNILKNIRELLKRGLFFGENAGYVHGSLDWLEGMIKKIESELPQPSTQDDESLKGHPKLEVVPNE